MQSTQPKKIAIAEPNTYRLAPSFNSNTNKPQHTRSQSNFLSSRTSPLSRGDYKQDQCQFSRPNINSKHIPSLKTQNNLRSILKRQFNAQNIGQSNQVTYSNVEKQKIITCLLQDNSMNQLKNQMFKIALNQSQTLNKQPSTFRNEGISQACLQRIPTQNNTSGIFKKSSENLSSNLSFTSTRNPIPNTKDALFKSLLRKNSAILSSTNYQASQHINSITIGQRSNSSISKELENKENQPQKTVQKLIECNTKQNLKNIENSNSNSNSIQNLLKPTEKPNIQNKKENKINQNQQQKNIQQINKLEKSKSQPKNKFPQYFQINLSEYIKSSNNQIEAKSTININQMLLENTSQQIKNTQTSHNIHKHEDSSNQSKLSNPSWQQLNPQFNSSSNTHSIEYLENVVEPDHLYRISTVKDTENSMLHDFRLEKNYIFLN